VFSITGDKLSSDLTRQVREVAAGLQYCEWANGSCILSTDLL
jgi:hypothetical protein